MIEQVTGEKPILLLDDVLSELDAGRQSWLLESIQDIQTLISCTGLDDFVNSRISLDKVFRVTEGRVQEEKQRVWFKKLNKWQYLWYNYLIKF